MSKKRKRSMNVLTPDIKAVLDSKFITTFLPTAQSRVLEKM